MIYIKGHLINEKLITHADYSETFNSIVVYFLDNGCKTYDDFTIDELIEYIETANKK